MPGQAEFPINLWPSAVRRATVDPHQHPRQHALRQFVRRCSLQRQHLPRRAGQFLPCRQSREPTVFRYRAPDIHGRRQLASETRRHGLLLPNRFQGQRVEGRNRPLDPHAAGDGSTAPRSAFSWMPASLTADSIRGGLVDWLSIRKTLLHTKHRQPYRHGSWAAASSEFNDIRPDNPPSIRTAGLPERTIAARPQTPVPDYPHLQTYQLSAIAATSRKPSQFCTLPRRRRRRS